MIILFAKYNYNDQAEDEMGGACRMKLWRRGTLIVYWWKAGGKEVARKTKTLVVG
jgi:hypothetical protein